MFFNNAVPRGGAIEEFGPMKRFMIALALLSGAVPPEVVLAKASARVLPYHRFCTAGVSDAKDLANKVDASIALKADGSAHLPGCQATAAQVRAAFQAAAPEEKIATFADLQRFLREGLVMVTLKESITFYSSCVRGKSLGAEDVLMRCEVQTLAAGTKVLASKQTGKLLVKLDCANIGFTALIESSCALINIPRGAVLAHVSFADASDQCAATRAAKPGTRDDGKGWTWFTPCSACDFSAFTKYTGWRTTPVGKTAIDIVGQQIRVSPNNRTDLCFEDAQGNVSDTVSVRPEDFKRAGDTMQATVGPEFIRYENRH